MKRLKLKLRAETIRALGSGQLAHAAGGMIDTWTNDPHPPSGTVPTGCPNGCETTSACPSWFCP